MKTHLTSFLLLSSGLLFTNVAAHAQQPSTTGVIVTKGRADSLTAPQSGLTEPDSVREHARRENARQLRKTLQERAAVAPAPPVQSATPVEQLSPDELAARKRARHEQELQMQQKAMKKKHPHH